MTELERLKKEIEYAKTEIIKNEKLYRCIKICDTPKILQSMRIKKLPILYTYNHLKKALKNKNYKKHYKGLIDDQILNIPKLIQDPALIMFDSNKEHHSDLMIFVEDYDKDNMPIVYNLKINGIGIYNNKNTKSNILLTVYGTNTMERDISREIRNKNIIYYNKEKMKKIFSKKEIREKLGQCLQRLCLQSSPILESNIILQYYHKVVKIDYSKEKDEFSDDINKSIRNVQKSMQVKFDKNSVDKAYQESEDIVKENIKNKDNKIKSNIKEKTIKRKNKESSREV